MFRDDRLNSQRTKMIMKNIEVGTNITAKREDLMPRVEETMVKERKKTDSTLMENTAYCKRTLTKFFDYKLIGLS